MADSLFCQFSHNTSLQAKGDKLRFFTGHHPYRAGGGVYNYQFSAPLIVCGLVFINDGIVHALTTDGVYEIIDGKDQGLMIQKIGNDL